MNRRRVIGIGETVLDIVFRNDEPQAAVPGGSTFNAIVSLGRAGTDCAIVTEVGDDHVGELTCRFMRDNGVSDRYVCRHEGVKSHISLAFLNEKNDAQYQFYKDHAGVTLGGVEPEFQKTDVVLFGSFFAINPAIREQVGRMLRSAHEAGATLYYDINFRKPHLADLPLTRDNIRENMALADIVRGSTEDFELLLGETDADRLYEKVSAYCKCLIVTDGAGQIMLRTPSVKMSYAVKKIDTVSTIGAGDNFNAGLLYGLMKEEKGDVLTMDEQEWGRLIASGQMFAQDVCQRLDNYISMELASQLYV